MSRSQIRLLAVSLAAAVLIQPGVSRAVPALFSHQGRLKDSTGTPLTGSHTLTFRLYDAASGGTIQWTHPQAVTLAGGLYTVNLPIDPSQFDGADYWMSVQVDGDPEIPERIQVVTAPYAARAAAADSATVGGGWKDLGSAVALVDSTNAVGIGTSVPGRPLHVLAASDNLFAARFESAHPGAAITELKNSSNNIIWEHAVAGSDGAFGGFVPSGSMYFYRQGSPVLAAVIDSNGNTGLGDVPLSDARLRVTSSTAADVSGLSADAYGTYSSVGVVGRALDGDYRTGVRGEVKDTSGSVASMAGVLGVAEGPAGLALYGSALGDFCQGLTAYAAGQKSIGVYASAGGANAIGLYGVVSGSNSRAGLFLGNVQINGVLTKTSGAFRIDHPLDPANKYLQHSFVESPDMKNIYDGVVALDADGRAVVELPDWFEALNKEFRYQLTCIGGYAPVYIESKVANNRFTIAGGTEGLEVSWQVTGIRRDAFANDHRIEVEVAKTGNERDRYLYPEALGLDASRGMDYERIQRVVPRSSPAATRAPGLSTDLEVTRKHGSR